jgi:hypothetical protein
MTNYTIYKRARELSFVQFSRWMNLHRNRNSNNARTLPSSVVECSEVGSSKAIIKKSTGALPIYEDVD